MERVEVGFSPPLVVPRKAAQVSAQRAWASPPGLPISNMDSVKSNSTTWLQLFVDAMTERDPYKRLALIRELRRVPRESEVEDPSGVVQHEGPRRERPRSRKMKTAS
jgi:hypothetical protein